MQNLGDTFINPYSQLIIPHIAKLDTFNHSVPIQKLIRLDEENQAVSGNSLNRLQATRVQQTSHVLANIWRGLIYDEKDVGKLLNRINFLAPLIDSPLGLLIVLIVAVAAIIYISVEWQGNSKKENTHNIKMLVGFVIVIVGALIQKAQHFGGKKIENYRIKKISTFKYLTKKIGYLSYVSTVLSICEQFLHTENIYKLSTDYRNLKKLILQNFDGKRYIPPQLSIFNGKLESALERFFKYEENEEMQSLISEEIRNLINDFHNYLQIEVAQQQALKLEPLQIPRMTINIPHLMARNQEELEDIV